MVERLQPEAAKGRPPVTGSRHLSPSAARIGGARDPDPRDTRRDALAAGVQAQARRRSHFRARARASSPTTRRPRDARAGLRATPANRAGERPALHAFEERLDRDLAR